MSVKCCYRIACEQALQGALGFGGTRKESLQLHHWNLNSTSNSPVTPCQVSCQSANQRNAETSVNVNKHWKTRAKGNDVNTNNVISANQHFALTFLMKIFKFQRRSEWELGYRYPVLLTSCLFALSGAQFGLPLIYCSISFWLLLLFFHYSDIIGVVWSDGN